MIYDNQDLLQAMGKEIEPYEPEGKLSRLYLFARNMAIMDSPYEAAIAAGVDDKDAAHFIRKAMDNPSVQTAIEHEKERQANVNKLMSLEGVMSSLTETLLIARGILPDPSIAMAFDPGQVPQSAYLYNGPLVLKAVDSILKVKQLESQGVVIQSSKDTSTQAAMRDIVAQIHEMD